MATHDYDIANQSGANFRTDLNNCLDAIVSNNSNASAPSTTFAYMLWVDTNNNVIKLRNSANNSWITLPLSTQASNTVDINGGAIDGTPIGANSTSTGAFTTLNASGVVTANAGVVVDNITIDGQEIDVSSGSLTLDIASDFIVDVDGGDVFLKDNGTEFGRLQSDNGDLNIYTDTSNKDILFKGNDGGSTITALTLDMSDGGTALFNNKVGIGTFPQKELHVHQNSGADCDIHMTNNATGSGADQGLTIFANSGSAGILYRQSAPLTFSTASTERMRIDSSGNVDIKSSNLYLTGSNDRRIKLSDSGVSGVSNSNNTVHIRGDNDNMKLNCAGNGGFIFEENGTEKMRLLSTGNLCVGRTGYIGESNIPLNLNSQGFAIGEGTGQNTTANTYRRAYFSASNKGLYFWNGNNQAVLTSAGVWTDASDERLKKDIVDIPYGLDAVKSLKPRKYKIKANDLEQVGFIAQEVKEIIPEVADLTIVEHTDEENGEQYSLSYGHLTAVLTKAIQEQQELIESLTARISTLEN